MSSALKKERTQNDIEYDRYYVDYGEILISTASNES